MAKYISLVEEAVDTRRRREWLIKAIRTHFVPSLIQRGFEQAPLVLHPPVDREYTQALPHGEFIRPRGETVDIVEVQFAPYRAAAFRINMSVRPIGGLVMYKGQRAFDHARGGITARFEMYQFPRLWGWLYFAWFKVRTLPLRSPTEGDYEKLAIKVAEYVNEIELALHQDQLGPHVRRGFFISMKS